MRIIIADSSTLITLLDTQNFSLIFLLFEEIIITDEVYNEITQKFNHKVEIDRYITSDKLTLQSIVHEEMYEMLIKRLDRGEAESITLAKSTNLPLIIDEKKGRNIAKSLNIPIIGLIGIILKLIDKKFIDKQKAIEIIQDIEINHFRLSDKLKQLVYDY